MYMKLNGSIIYYNISGNGEPLILLHGNGENQAIFQEALAVLEERYQVILLDTRGHGNSIMTDPDFHYDDMAIDLADFINALNLTNVNIFGFSDGAIVALLYSIKHSSNVKQLLLGGLNINPKGFKLRTKIAMFLVFAFTAKPLYGLMLSEPNINLADLNSLRTKVTLIYGEKDIMKKKHITMIKENIIGAHLLFVPKANHSSYVIHNREIGYIIKDLLEENNENQFC